MNMNWNLWMGFSRAWARSYRTIPTYNSRIILSRLSDITFSPSYVQMYFNFNILIPSSRMMSSSSSGIRYEDESIPMPWGVVAGMNTYKHSSYDLSKSKLKCFI